MRYVRHLVGTANDGSWRHGACRRRGSNQRRPISESRRSARTPSRLAGESRHVLRGLRFFRDSGGDIRGGCSRSFFDHRRRRRGRDDASGRRRWRWCDRLCNDWFGRRGAQRWTQHRASASRGRRRGGGWRRRARGGRRRSVYGRRCRLGLGRNRLRLMDWLGGFGFRLGRRCLWFFFLARLRR